MSNVTIEATDAGGYLLAVWPVGSYRHYLTVFRGIEVDAEGKVTADYHCMTPIYPTQDLIVGALRDVDLRLLEGRPPYISERLLTALRKQLK